MVVTLVSPGAAAPQGERQSHCDPDPQLKRTLSKHESNDRAVLRTQGCVDVIDAHEPFTAGIQGLEVTGRSGDE